MRDVMMRLLTNDPAKLALGSALIQIATFLVLLLGKATLPVEDFAFLLIQLAIAGIIGATASMRLDVLIFQAHKRFTHAVILMPIAAIVGVIALIFATFVSVSTLLGGGMVLSPHLIPMIAGLGLSTVQNYVFVQVKRVDLLLAARMAQSGGLALLMALVVFGRWSPTGKDILLVTGISYAVPSLISLTYFLKLISKDRTAPPALFIPNLSMLRRALVLTVATGINSLYVSLPLLVAAATQSSSFVADFGLIMRAFTAPITLIGQVIGRLFLVETISWSITTEKASATLSKLISRAIFQSAGIFVLVTPLLIGALYTYRSPLNINHFDIAPYIFLAALGQCVINPVAQVRISLHDEQSFLVFDALRLLSLTLGLYVIAELIAFEVAFAATSLTLYMSYIAFIFFRVSRYVP